MRSCAERRRRAGAPAALAVAALAACSVASPASEVKEALANLAPVELDAGGARITLARASFSDVVVATEGTRARVMAMVQADGRVRLAAAEPSLAYVGREAFEMSRCAGRRWCLAPDALGGLRGVVAALAAAPRPGDDARPVAWQVRVERDTAEAGEDYESPGGTPPRADVTEAAAPRRLRARHALARDGGTWRVLPSR